MHASYYIDSKYGCLEKNQYRISASSDALIKTQGNCHCFERAFSISFRCQHKSNQIEDQVNRLYQDIIAGNAHLLLQANPNQCAHGDVTGGCGNIRGHLYECRCEALDRVRFKSRRELYENTVIEQIHKIIHEQKGQTFSVNLAIFGSGGFHGEQVLIMRLLNEIRDHHAGTINLFLIDTDYKKSIALSGSVYSIKPGESFSWDLLIGNRPDLKQFLTEIAQCLPSHIQLNGTLFGDANEYILRAQNDPNFRHDLLMGSDIGDNIQWMNKIKQTTSRTDKDAILLIKAAKETPLLCTLPSLGQLKCDRL